MMGSERNKERNFEQKKKGSQVCVISASVKENEAIQMSMGKFERKVRVVCIGLHSFSLFIPAEEKKEH